MSDDLVSLDDIIKKKKSSGAMRNQGPLAKNAPKAAAANGAGLNRVNKPNNRPIEDARFKIIQKKRKHIADARDKLAQIAKQSDARLKLQKLRATNAKKVDPASISRKTGRTGRITLSTNERAAPHIPRSMPSFIQPHARPMSYRPPPIPEPRYVNEMMMNYNNDYLMDHQAALRRTVSNDYAPSLPPPPPLFDFTNAVPFDWGTSTFASSKYQSARAVDQSRPRDYKVIPRVGMNKNESVQQLRDAWSFNSKARTIIPDSALEAKYYAIKNHRDIGVKSRLDSPPLKASRMAVASSSRPKSSSQTPGYRIVVSNLQPNVTQEDIKELFEDVGELLVSRLVRPGTAEVIYKTLKDATKAVETYHNRQLDGHPMKCLLVNPRPKTSSSTSSGRVLSQSRSSSGYSQPSWEMVHHALFNN